MMELISSLERRRLSMIGTMWPASADCLAILLELLGQYGRYMLNDGMDIIFGEEETFDDWYYVAR